MQNKRKPKCAYGAPKQWLLDNRSHVGNECLIWPFARNPKGYAHIFGGKPCRMMCEFVHGPAPSPIHQAAHGCGKGHEGCVNPQHLRWATPAENESDKLIHGTRFSASKGRPPRLTADEVRAIRALRGVITGVDIATQFGISRGHVANIFSGEKWGRI